VLGWLQGHPRIVTATAAASYAVVAAAAAVGAMLLAAAPAHRSYGAIAVHTSLPCLANTCRGKARYQRVFLRGHRSTTLHASIHATV
jgi:hypothetical protein